MKRNKGITLIALVITIIILLILAGISIAMLTGDNGILKKATTAKENTIIAQYEEELNLVIAEMRTDAIYKNEKFDMPYIIEKLPEYLNANGKKDYTWDIEDTTIEEPEGEYKEYEFFIDKNYKVHIGDKIKGISFSYTLTPTGYTKENITLTVNAKSTNGNITNIEVSEVNRNNDGTFTITENKEYQVTVTDSTGNTRTKPLNIQKIDKVNPVKVEVSIEDVKAKEFTIKVDAEDGEATTSSVKSGIGKYVYNINGREPYESEEPTYKVTELDEGTEYTIQVTVYDKAGNNNIAPEIKQKTLTIPKEIYINANTGDDATGNGTQEKPYKTLGKIAETGIIVDSFDYNVHLNNGVYELTNQVFNLGKNNIVNIYGNKQQTTLKYPDNVTLTRGLTGSQGSLHFYRLIWKDEQPKNRNYTGVYDDLYFHNVVFDVNGKCGGASYFMTDTEAHLYLINCSVKALNQSFLRNYSNGLYHCLNCYGFITSYHYGGGIDVGQIEPNYGTLTPQLDETTYRITEDESVWKNVGTGTNPDGTQANFGVYGGEYSWEK